MIVRLVHCRSATSREPPVPEPRTSHRDQPRDRLVKAAAKINGLETLVVGWRGSDRGASASAPSVVITAWRDAELMVAAIGPDERRFLRDRLGLRVEIDSAESYEVLSRTFGSLPAPTSVLRIVKMAARERAESALFERLRDIQHWLTSHGLIASHVARRVVPAGIEVVIIGVWIDRGAIEAATVGQQARIVFPDELEPLIEHADIETYDALEVAPRLPLASGPPILILDDARRVVDLTPSAAAILGRTQDEAIGMLVEDIAAEGDRDGVARWSRLLDVSRPEALTTGEAAWLIPSGGHVMIRWLLRRDAPVAGRHTILVRRRHEPAPTEAEMDTALANAFPIGTDRTGEA